MRDEASLYKRYHHITAERRFRRLSGGLEGFSEDETKSHLHSGHTCGRWQQRLGQAEEAGRGCRAEVGQNPLPVSPSFRYVLAAQIHQHLQDTNTFVLLLVEASDPKTTHTHDLSQKPFVFGQEAPTVLHRDIQRPPVELHHGHAELKPARQTLF